MKEELDLRQRVTAAFNDAYPRWQEALAAREWVRLPVAFGGDGEGLLEMILSKLEEFAKERGPCG